MNKNKRLNASGFPVGKFSRIWGRVDQTAKTITIGDFVTLGTNSFVASHCPVKGVKKEKLTTKIENDVWIGYNSLISPGTTIGRRTIIGMGSVVSGNIQKDSIYVGNPAKRVKTRNPIEVVRTRLYMRQGLGPNDTPKWNITEQEINEIFSDIHYGDLGFLLNENFCKRYFYVELPDTIQDTITFLTGAYNG